MSTDNSGKAAPARSDHAAPGPRRRVARLRDVAARAGVSPGLVSRLLNNDASLTVRPETREAVLAAVRDLGYVPNSSAASLRRSRTNVIGLVLERVTSPVFSEIVQGAEDAAAEHGYGLLMADAFVAERDETFLRELVRSRRVDGLLLQGGYSTAAIRLAAVAEEIPTVIINNPGTQVASGVQLPYELATRMATEHLLELGHRDIAFVEGLPGPATDTRRRGYEHALHAAGLAVRPELLFSGGWEAEEGRRGVLESLASGSGPRPTGYVIASSVAALGALTAFAESGLRVPEDVSVVSVQDPWFTAYVSPPLTTVWLPLFELGHRSVEQLVRHLKSGKPPEVLITDPPPHLVVRASTRPL